MNQALATKIYESGLLISRIAILNILWIAGVILGLGIFGFLPATVALYSVFRRAQHQEGEFKWFSYAVREYFFYFKKLFFTSMILTIIGSSLFLSYYTLGSQHLLLNSFIKFLLVYLFLLVIPNFAVNLVHFEVPVSAIIKNSFMLPLFWGVTSLKVLFFFLASAILSYLFPGIIPFFTVSIPIYLSNSILLERWEKQLDNLEIAGGE